MPAIGALSDQAMNAWPSASAIQLRGGAGFDLLRRMNLLQADRVAVQGP